VGEEVGIPSRRGTRIGYEDGSEPRSWHCGSDWRPRLSTVRVVDGASWTMCGVVEEIVQVWVS
jgi:hypothetical protein